MTDNGEWVKIAEEAQLDQWDLIGAKVGDQYVAVYKVDGLLYATSGLCPHAFALLSDGFLEGYVVECPLHGYCFDVRTGRAQGSVATSDLEVFPVRRQGEHVEVQIKTKATA